MPALHFGIEGVAGTKSESSPDRPGKDDLSLAGNAGLHGKNILPHERPLRPQEQDGFEGRLTLPPISARRLEYARLGVRAEYVLKRGADFAHRGIGADGV